MRLQRRLTALLCVAMATVVEIVFLGGCVDGKTPDCSDAATPCSPDLDGTVPEAASTEEAGNADGASDADAGSDSSTDADAQLDATTDDASDARDAAPDVTRDAAKDG